MIPKNILKQYPYIWDESILIGYRGSVAHGMYVPRNEEHGIDDKDVMSIVIPDLKYYLGIEEWGSRGTREHFINEWDIVCYEIRKFIKLLCKAKRKNINIRHCWNFNNLIIVMIEQFYLNA